MTDAEVEALATAARAATPNMREWVHAYRIYDLPAQDDAYLDQLDPAAVLRLIERLRDAEAKVAATKSEKKMCPFSDPKYTIPVDQPCPVCGDIGRMTDEPSKCIDDVGTAP